MRDYKWLHEYCLNRFGSAAALEAMLPQPRAGRRRPRPVVVRPTGVHRAVHRVTWVNAPCAQVCGRQVWTGADDSGAAAYHMVGFAPREIPARGGAA